MIQNIQSQACVNQLKSVWWLAVGGKPGQWSARKAQLVASEYKKKGGGYKGGQSSKQKDLKKWGKEDWQTKDQYEKGKKAAAAAKKHKEKK